MRELVPPARTVAWIGERPGFVRLLDQTRLPLEEVEFDVRTLEEMRAAIHRLAVRGAPAIGVAGGYGLVLGVQALDALGPEALRAALASAAERLASARPTAINLAWAVERVHARGRSELARGAPAPAVLDALLAEARAIELEDARMCAQIGAIGAKLLRDGARVLTHCNAGALATAGIGTALAPVYAAVQAGRRVSVIADETRPLLQGARLTAWELQRAGIEVTLITDGMAARVMAEGKVDLVLVGADRIARNGDVCNKIGTYGVAVAAQHHGIPFYAVAPSSTFDLTLAHGGLIPIEERAAEEITEGLGRRTAPPGVKVYNPAFDVTPARLVAGIVTERGLIERPDEARVLALLGAAAAR